MNEISCLVSHATYGGILPHAKVLGVSVDVDKRQADVPRARCHPSPAPIVLQLALTEPSRYNTNASCARNLLELDQ